MKKSLLFAGFVGWVALMGTPESFADTTPSSCFAERNSGDVTFDYTVYFKHDFPKVETNAQYGHLWCSMGKRKYSKESYVDSNGCCITEDLKENNGKQQCCNKDNATVCFSTIWDDLKTDLEANSNGQCGQSLYRALQAISLSDDTRILLIATADKTGRDAYNRDLAERRLWTIKQLFTPAQQAKIMVINGGESNDNFTDTTGRNVAERTVRIIVAGQAQVQAIIDSYAKVETHIRVDVVRADAAAATQRINNIVTRLKGQTANLDTSVWKDKNGNFNTSRLVSDSVAGVVLGTAGGLITSNVIKKNQLKGGFEDIKCTVGGQVVAEYNDDFMVGIR